MRYFCYRLVIHRSAKSGTRREVTGTVVETWAYVCLVAYFSFAMTFATLSKSNTYWLTAASFHSLPNPLFIIIPPFDSIEWHRRKRVLKFFPVQFKMGFREVEVLIHWFITCVCVHDCTRTHTHTCIHAIYIYIYTSLHISTICYNTILKFLSKARQKSHLYTAEALV